MLVYADIRSKYMCYIVDVACMRIMDGADIPTVDGAPIGTVDGIQERNSGRSGGGSKV